MSLTAAPYVSLSQLPPLYPVTSLSAAKKKTLAASHALHFLQSLPLQLDLLVDPSSSHNPYFGILITHVERPSTAYSAGLRPGDVLLEFNGVRTVSLDDFRRGLQGCIAGDEVLVVVERGEEELQVRVMIGGVGVGNEEVRAMYRLLMEEVAAQEAKTRSPLTRSLSPSSLALCDLLGTPQFAHSLLAYMESSKCGECLQFLLAEAAYQRIPPLETLRLMKAAHAIYDSFIAEDAAQMVNIDSGLRRELQSALHNGDFVPTLFHPAAKAVYQLTETDVLPRYFLSSIFAALTLPGGWQAANDSTIGRGRRRTNSFSCLPMEERRVELEDMRTAFQTDAAADIGTHRKGLTAKYKDSFKGSVLLHWLLKVGVCEHEATATTMGQRLMDAFLLWRCEEGDEDSRGDFVADDTLYSLQPPEVIDTVDDDSCESAYVLVKGVHYTRLWMKVHRRKRKLSLYRDQHSTQTLFKASLRNASLTLYTPQNTSSTPTLSSSRPSSDSSLNHSPSFLSVASPTSTPPRSSSRAVAPVTPPPSPLNLSFDGSSSAVSSARYLHVSLKDSHAPRSEVVLRVDDEKEARGWAQLMSELGVTVKGL